MFILEYYIRLSLITLAHTARQLNINIYNQYIVYINITYYILLNTASATVTIYVEDINDHAPQFTQKVYKATMSENLAIDGSITSISATDKDIGKHAKLTYILKEQDRTYFSMSSVEATNTGVLKVYKVRFVSNEYIVQLLLNK